MAADDELTTPVPTRAGSNADLARRMDRMEIRQDTMESKVTDLATVVARVEQNQTHTAELNKLRFDALDTSTKTIVENLTSFIKRIDSLMTGETTTANTRSILDDYAKFRDSTLTRLDELEDTDLKGSAKNDGVIQTFGAGKAVIVTAAAAITAIIAILGFVLTPHP